MGGVLLSLPVLAPFGAVAAVGLLHGSRVADVNPGRALFEARCGGCHDLGLSLYYIKTPAEWARTVKTQVEVEGVPLDQEEQDQVHAFLSGMRSYSDAWTFRTRCQRCHTSTSNWRHRPARDWAAIVSRVARTSPYYYRADVRDQLLRHLGQAYTNEQDRAGLGKETAYQLSKLDKRCGSCHALSYEAPRYQAATEEQALALVRRMNSKMARPLTAAETKRTADAYRKLVRDPASITRLFPHDVPREDGRLKW